MARKIYVNVPVKDLTRSIDFYTKVGFSFNQQFSNENATSIIVSDDILVMLLQEDFFKNFTNKPIANAKESTEVLISISAESREEVDEMVGLAIAAGGASPVPTQDHGWMYGRSFEDPDGHIWEVSYLDMSAIPEKA
ncbi:VOC family protein [Pedobacter nanyangensis]|uniref:VOC family protein n=1 Tax=Pedobacter nanyangensis TaxID=1562389 RepID=UPI000DE21EA5|nr:VOC family protein [Pedobacter nanyangensis]